MKVIKKGFLKILVILLILSIPTFFIYTRFCLKMYEIRDSGTTLIFENTVYSIELSSSTPSFEDEENFGKTIGVAVSGKRTTKDYIFPDWVLEYKNDKEHKRLVV